MCSLESTWRQHAKSRCRDPHVQGVELRGAKVAWLWKRAFLEIGLIEGDGVCMPRLGCDGCSEKIAEGIGRSQNQNRTPLAGFEVRVGEWDKQDLTRLRHRSKTRRRGCPSSDSC